MATKGKIKIQPANKGGIFGYIATATIFFALGILSFILILIDEIPGSSPPQTYGEALAGILEGLLLAVFGITGALAKYWWVILLLVIGLTVLGFLVGWLLLVLVAKLGHILVYAGCVVYIVGAIIGAIVAFATLGAAGSITPLVPAALLLITIVTNFKKLQRAGEFMKFTGQVVLAEKGMIIAPLFVTGMSILSGLAMISIFARIVLWFPGAVFGYILASIASLIQLVIYFGMFYAAEGVNTTYAYEWYRKRDPDMKFCLRNVAGNFGAIFLFGIATAFVSWLQQVLRNTAASAKGKGGLILAIIARIVAAVLGFIWKYLTYFTLPAIVVEGRGFKDGVTRSFDLLKRYYMDVLIRETGVERGFAIVQWISFFIYGVVGALTGLIVWQTTSLSLAAGLLVCIIPALLFANVPTFFIFRPMKTAYLTFVFAYAQDEETSFKLPTRMPRELRGDLKEAGKSLDPDKSIANMYG
ncbi:MAG: hypothetical protein GF308_15290 [Candidatus Heimdallarchaeota archaeon]|nr:hypothetical protein [Candidatus Heimdallarchaeota archaeon]